jgi:hypothetical protein
LCFHEGRRAEDGGRVKERVDDGVILMATREPCRQCESEEGEGVGVGVGPQSCSGHVGSRQGGRRSQQEGKGRGWSLVVGEKNAGRCHTAMPKSAHDMHDNTDSEHRQCAKDRPFVAMGVIKRDELRDTHNLSQMIALDDPARHLISSDHNTFH